MKISFKKVGTDAGAQCIRYYNIYIQTRIEEISWKERKEQLYVYITLRDKKKTKPRTTRINLDVCNSCSFFSLQIIKKDKRKILTHEQGVISTPPHSSGEKKDS